MSNLETEKIIKGIRGNVVDRRESIIALTNDHAVRNSVIGYIKNHGGSDTEALTTYNDMIVSFIKIVHTRPSFSLDIQLPAYLMGIAKNVWYNELRKRGRHTTVDLENIKDIEDKEIPQVELLIKGDRASILNSVLSQMKIKCKEVLMYWSGGYKMQEIANLVGYKSEGMARKKKSECLKELLTYLAANPHIKEQLSKI